jgi:hypothetical protein
MKKNILLLFLIINTFLSFSQEMLYKGNNVLMPGNLLVDYSVPLYSCLRPVNGVCPDSIAFFSVENKVNNSIFDIILNSAFNDRILLYKPIIDDYSVYTFPEKKKRINANEIKERLGSTEQVVEFADSTGSLIEKWIVKEFDKNELFGIRFIEEWIVSENPFSMTKNVIGYCPIRKFYKPEDFNFSQPQYTNVFLFLDTLLSPIDIEQSNKRMVLTNEIEYEYYLNKHNNNFNDTEGHLKYFKTLTNAGFSPFINPASPYLNNFGIEHFVEFIINKSLKQKYPVYDPFTKEKLSSREVLSRLDCRSDTFDVLNHKTNRMEKQIVEDKINYQDIQSVIFHEQWYIDPVTLRLQKKVNGISLIKWYYKSEDAENENLQRKYVFTIYFDGKK